jgi:hypothetical protein
MGSCTSISRVPKTVKASVYFRGKIQHLKEDFMSLSDFWLKVSHRFRVHFFPRLFYPKTFRLED